MKSLKKSLFALMAALVVAAAVPSGAQAKELMFTAEKGESKAEAYEAFVGYDKYELYVTDTSNNKVTIDSWKSSNTNVIKVAKKDSKTAVMKTIKKGNAKVYAYKNGAVVATFNFKVISGMSLSTTKPNVEKGKVKVVKANLAFVGKIKAASSNKAVCTVKVSETGRASADIKITGVKTGTATVKVSNSETKEVINLKVTVKGASVMSLSTTETSVKKGSTVKVKGTLTKSGNFKASVADSSICSVKVKKVDSKHANLEITGKKVGSTSITVKNTVNSEAIKLKVKVTSATSTSKTERRALVIGQGYAGLSNVSALPACLNDAASMKRMLGKTGYDDITMIKDANKSKIKSSIAKAFAKADADDVSFFYYSGHGAEDGSLCSNEGSSIDFIPPRELASWLKKVPGKVVVVLDACYSGQLINKSGDSDYASEQVIKAFAEEDEIIKAGEFCTNKFQVITASSKTEMSWCSNEFGYFTFLLVNGVGYDYDTGSKQKAEADRNKDNKLTTYECWKFVSDQLDGIRFQNRYYQTPKCYPANSSFVLFQR